MERNRYHPEVSQKSHLFMSKDEEIDFQTVYDRRFYPYLNTDQPYPSPSHPKIYVQNHN